MSTMKVVTLRDESAVIDELCKLIEKLAKDAIVREDVFKVGLSGGSLATFLSKGLPKINTDWSKWKLFFCDERVVPLDSSDSNYGVYKTALIGVVPLVEDQFVKINPHLPAHLKSCGNESYKRSNIIKPLTISLPPPPTSARGRASPAPDVREVCWRQAESSTAEEAARDYIQKMAVHFPPDELPRFHLLLLGMGPDGHTCSLFPGHRLLEETSVWVAPITDSPKPPPSRVTLTFPVVNNAECCAFAVVGQNKAEMVKRILKDGESLPAARVNPTKGQVYWLLDQGAASLINGS